MDAFEDGVGQPLGRRDMELVLSRRGDQDKVLDVVGVGDLGMVGHKDLVRVVRLVGVKGERRLAEDRGSDRG